MSKLINTAILMLSSLLIAGTVLAKNNIQMIEQEYARYNHGQMISDQQLGYYLDQENAGWSFNQITQDIVRTQGQYAKNTWQPKKGWTAREIVCSSQDKRYSECVSPFSGRAVVTEQISQSVCIENQTWGQKQGVIWVNRGCRARFGNVRVTNNHILNAEQMIVCQSKLNQYRQCNTGTYGRVQLVKKLNNSSACISGRTWGQRKGMVWVTSNCRAQFATVAHFNQQNNYSVTCSSNYNKQDRCKWDDRYGQPQLQEQLSKKACINGRTWGYDNSNGIWVNNGCRARFVSSQITHNNNYTVTCTSDNKDPTHCIWEDRYGEPYVVQQLSSKKCIKGKTWAYYRNRDLWVSKGCSALFGAKQ